VKQEIPRLKVLLVKVVAVHGGGHPELAGVQKTFAALAEELEAHMMKEEIVLFPYIQQLEKAISMGSPQ
jgi:regulator of cell morphogenesis and NO signaling